MWFDLAVDALFVSQAEQPLQCDAFFEVMLLITEYTVIKAAEKTIIKARIFCVMIFSFYVNKNNFPTWNTVNATPHAINVV